MNTTVRIKASEIYKDWHVIDAAGRPLGRVASEAAILLRGKHKPTYERHLDDGDFVIIINAADIKVSGRKAEQIKYYSHSGYPGGLRTRTYEEERAKHPERVLERAVWGMLPGGPLGEAIFKHLKVYRGPHHPHQSQVTGSDRARAARAEVQKQLAEAPRKAPPRLRALSVPAVAATVISVAEPPPPPAKPKPTRAKALRVEAEAGAVEEPVANADEKNPVATAEAVTAAVEAQVPDAPRRTRTRTTTAKPASEASAEPAATPKPRAARATKAATGTAAEETPEKKPTRRRSPARTEE